MCKENGLYLGKDDVYINCNNVCKMPGFAYHHFNNTSYLTKYLVSGKAGAYCIPEKIVKCNPYMSTIVRDAYDWKCYPKFPSIFGGANGTDIQVCNGELTDMLTGENYKHSIPINLQVQDPENETISLALTDHTPYVTKDVYLQFEQKEKIDDSDGGGGGGGSSSGSSNHKHRSPDHIDHPRFVCTSDLVYRHNGFPTEVALNSITKDELGNAYVLSLIHI